MVLLWYLHRNYSEGTTGLFPTFRLVKRKKKLRAISDTQHENIFVIRLRDITFAYAVSLSRKLKSLKCKNHFISCYARTLRTPQSRVLQRVQDHSAHRAVRCRDRYARSSR